MQVKYWEYLEKNPGEKSAEILMSSPQELLCKLFFLLDGKDERALARVSRAFYLLSTKFFDFHISAQIKSIIKANWTYNKDLDVDKGFKSLDNFKWAEAKFLGITLFNVIVDTQSAWLSVEKACAAQYVSDVVKTDVARSPVYLLELLLYVMLKSNLSRCHLGPIVGIGKNAYKEKIFNFGTLDENLKLIAGKILPVIQAMPDIFQKAVLSELCNKILLVPETAIPELEKFLQFKTHELLSPVPSVDPEEEKLANGSGASAIKWLGMEYPLQQLLVEASELAKKSMPAPAHNG